MRCTPQVHGVVLETLDFVREICLRELNAATDNPLVFNDGRLVSAGNFHGEYPGKAADYLAIALSEYCCISERRIERMLNPTLSGPNVRLPKDEYASRSPTNEASPHDIIRSRSSINYNVLSQDHTFSLPPFLMPAGSSGLNSGMMIPHCTAASLVNENKV